MIKQVYDLILKNISRFITLAPDEEKYFISLLKTKRLKKKNTCCRKVISAGMSIS
jgi:hypothetical protein